MRKLLPFLLVLLVSPLTVAAPAHALSLPTLPGNLAAAATEEDEELEAGDEVEDGEEAETEGEEAGCTVEDGEEAQLCAEIAEEERESEEAERHRPRHRGKQHRHKSKSAHRRHHHRSRHHRANRARHPAR